MTKTPPKIRLVMVMSINGKITQDNSSDIYSWTSLEDQDQFFKEIKKAKLIIMGSSTYSANQEKIKPNSKQIRIVLTSKPTKFKKNEVKSQLIFRNFSPTQVIQLASNQNIKEILLVGGSKINSIFLKENLVDEVKLTIEPKMFGKGVNLAADGNFNLNFKLKSLKKLNKTGTILVVYEKQTQVISRHIVI